MYLQTPPREYRSMPFHGAYRADTPGISLGIRLDLTQEEAASVLAAFTVGLGEDDLRITPADTPEILRQVITYVTLHTIRQAARGNAEDEAAHPQDSRFYVWCRQLVRQAV